MLSAHDIKDIIPHRYPFLHVDKVIEKEEGKRVVGLKNVSINEPFFQGHFPEHPVMSGVLILDEITKVSVIAILDMEENKGKIRYLEGDDKCRFKSEVTLDNQLQ